MAAFLKFRKVERTNPTTGEVVVKLIVLDKNFVEYTLLTDLTVDAIKQRRDELLATVKLISTQHGTCAVFDRSKVLEEF